MEETIFTLRTKANSYYIDFNRTAEHLPYRVFKNEKYRSGFNTIGGALADIIQKQGTIHFYSDQVVEELQKKTEVDAKELALLTAVITHNCFDELYKHYNSGGVMDCFDAITELATMFEAKYRHVTEWAEYLDSIKYEGTDWEEFVIDFAMENKDNISSLQNIKR